MDFSRTVIIGCAGMGNRLGMGTTKALINIEGKPLIVRHLENLKDEKDIRVVVGYQAEEVIKVVNSVRDDVMFVFNHDYRTTGTGASVALAAKHANEYVLSIDGDLIVHPEDIKKVLQCQNEFVGGGEIESEDPWMLEIYDEDGKEYVSAFSRECGKYEWNGITQIKSGKVLNGKGHVFQLIEPYLPIEFMKIRTCEIDTMMDYDNAVKWIRNGYR